MSDRIARLSPSHLLLACLALMLIGCGFQLRGSAELPARFSPLFIDGAELQPEQLGLIRNALNRASARLVPTAEQANRLVVKFALPPTRRLAGSSPTGVELRQLGMTLVYRLEDSTGRLLVETRRLEQSSEIELDSANVLAHAELIEQGLRQLRQNLIQSMVFQLSRM